MTDEGRFQLPDGTEVALVLPPAGDVLGDQIRQGSYEVAPAHRLVLDLLGPGTVLVDAGAHIGTLSTPAAARGATVVAVEPNPVNAALLRSNTAGQDVTVVEAALGAIPGTVSFLADGAWGRVVDGTAAGAATVQVVTGRELLGVLGRPPDVVKLDVEGFEIEAIAGMAPLLTHRPPLIFESNAYALALRGRSTAELLGSVERLGYSIYRIEPEGRLVTIDAALHQGLAYIDCVGLVDVPESLVDWRVLPRPTADAVAVEVAAQARDRLVDLRRWVVSSLAGAPDDVRCHPRTLAALAMLRRDPDRRVRWAARRLSHRW